MASKAVKVALPVVVAGVVGGYFGYPAYANSEFETNVVKKFEDRGFAVRHSGVSYDHSKGFGTLVVDEYAMTRNGGVMKLRDVRVEGQTAHFEGGEFKADKEQGLTFGAGSITYVPKQRLIVDVSDVVAQTEQASPLTQYVDGEIADPDVRFSVEPSVEGQEASLRVSSEGFGALSASINIANADLWELTGDSAFSSLVQTAEIVSADLTFENQGGVEMLMSQAAEEEGVTEEELKAMLTLGFGGAQVTPDIKTAVVGFLEDPGVLSVQISPKTKSAGQSAVRMTFPDMFMGFQMMQTGQMQPAEYFDALGFKVVSSPKSTAS